MLINDVTSSGALPSLEATLRFAGARQRLIAHNIANVSTPGFQPKDVSVGDFQEQLGEAVDARRARTGGAHGKLGLKSSREVAFGPGGRLTLTPDTTSGNILFHDRNDRDLERMMQALAENTGVYRVASELIRAQMDVLRAAITERA